MFMTKATHEAAIERLRAANRELAKNNYALLEALAEISEMETPGAAAAAKKMAKRAREAISEAYPD